MTNQLSYNEQDKRNYLAMVDTIGMKWLLVFDTPAEDKSFWDTAYWDLFTKLWKVTEVKKTDAISFITGKTMPTATKYLNSAIEQGLVTERENPNDPRSKLVGLSEEMRKRLDIYFDSVLTETEALMKIIRKDTE